MEIKTTEEETSNHQIERREKNKFRMRRKRELEKSKFEDNGDRIGSQENKRRKRNEKAREHMKQKREIERKGKERHKIDKGMEHITLDRKEKNRLRMRKNRELKNRALKSFDSVYNCSEKIAKNGPNFD